MSDFKVAIKNSDGMIRVVCEVEADTFEIAHQKVFLALKELWPSEGKTFMVGIRERHTQSYRIRAHTREQAIQKAQDGDFEEDLGTEFVETLDSPDEYEVTEVVQNPDGTWRNADDVQGVVP